MKLYHGSSVIIEKPDVLHTRGNLDFGKGFYLTTYRTQADRWAQRKALRAESKAVVNVYDFSEDYTGYNVLQFNNENEDWIKFVCACRRGSNAYSDYDLIIGGVANDKVYAAVDMYFKGIWDIERTLSELKFYKINDQLCIINQQLINDSLKFLEFYEVG
jgi:hypothetical protein